MTATLDAILDAQAEQLNMTDLLATIEAEEEIITLCDMHKGYNPEEAATGDCPHTQSCETRRRRLPHYLPRRCHWIAWGDWRRGCPIYRNNGGE